MACAQVEAAKMAPQVGIVWVQATKIAPQLRIVQVEAAKIAPQLGLSPKFDHRILLILRLGTCMDGGSKNSAIDRAVTKFWYVRRWIPHALQRV